MSDHIVERINELERELARLRSIVLNPKIKKARYRPPPGTPPSTPARQTVMDEEEQATPNNNGPTMRVNEADDAQEVVPVISLITHPRQPVEGMNQRTVNHGSPVQIQSPVIIDGSRMRRAPVYETDILANMRTDKDTCQLKSYGTTSTASKARKAEMQYPPHFSCKGDFVRF